MSYTTALKPTHKAITRFTVNVDVIIVGQGLAGSILAWHLIQKQLRVAVIDDSHRSSSSMVAAGLVNPITGKRLVKSWEVDCCLPIALQFYRHLESALGLSLYQEKSILRLFAHEGEKDLWESRRLQSEYQAYLGDLYFPNPKDPQVFKRSGGFYIRQSGFLHTKALLTALKKYLQQRHCLVEGEVDYADINVSRSNVSWKNMVAHRLVFCEGHRIKDNPWFSYLPLQPAQGEILSVKTAQPLPDHIINCGKWLLPIEPDTLKIGATFQWQPIDNTPTAKGKQQLLEAGRNMGWDVREADVLQHLCGVRPGTRDKKPFMGSHPSHSRLKVFNGFGAKGSLWIPYFASLFADYLCGTTELPDEIDIKRFD